MCRPSGGSALLALGAWVLLSSEALLAQDACEVSHLPSPDAGISDFGFAVAVSDDTAVISLPSDDDNGNDSGSAYVFRFDGTTWVQEQKLLASDGHGGVPTGDEFGYSAAIDGDTAVVGALGHAHAGISAAGAAYVFRHNGSTWVQEQELRASDGQVQDIFGASAAIRGNLALIGAPGDDDNGGTAGAAYVFRFDGASWVQEQKLLPSDAGGSFGESVAIDGDVAVVGALQADVNSGLIGAAYVFRFDGASWSQEQKLKAFDIPGPTDFFGESVSVHADVALVGARGGGSGSAYVFRYDPLQAPGFRWVGEQSLVASYSELDMQFGKSVAIEGDTALIGAWLSDLAGLDHGAAYIFRFVQGSGWVEQQTLLPQPGPWTAFYGYSVGLSSDVGVVGAYGEGGEAGAAYLYSGMSGVDCNANGVGDTCDILGGTSADVDANGIPDECVSPWDLDGSGAVAINDFLGLLSQWGTNPGGPPDFDGDGTVGVLDFLDLLAHWGPCA